MSLLFPAGQQKNKTKMKQQQKHLWSNRLRRLGKRIKQIGLAIQAEKVAAAATAREAQLGDLMAQQSRLENRRAEMTA